MIIPETEIIVTKDGAELARATVKPGDYVIGRGTGSDILVPAEDVAERHAMLTVNYHELFIEDLGSGGTFVAGRAVTEYTRIWPNQKIRIGSACFEARRVKAPSDSELSLPPEVAMVRDFLPAEFLREKKYDIGGLVAQDGMGETVDAFEATTGRTVAMKVMLSTLSEAEILRFIAEAQLTSQLEHPNIIPVHELGVDEEEHVFYTMKLIRGETLKRILKRIADGDAEMIAQYPLAQLLTVFQKVCDAVAFAHSRSVTHRQLKPANITIGEFGEVLVMNWGDAEFLWTSPPESDVEKRAPAKANSTSTLAKVSTDPHSSPGPKVFDPREDILALGAILYQVLGFRAPTTGDAAKSKLPERRAPDSLVAVAKKARSVDPANRYASVVELQADLAAYQDGFATSAEQASLWKQLALLVRRHRREAKALAASVVLLLALGLGAYVYVARERNAALFERHRAEEQRNAADQQRLAAADERTRAENERQRAERTLGDLSTAAPAYHRQALALIQSQKFPEALESIGLAIALAPDNPDYPLLQGHALQAMQRLPEAVASYQRVLALRPADDSAKTNLALCERLLTAAAGKPLQRAQQTELLNAIIAQKRSAAGVFLASMLAREDETRFAKMKEQLAPLTKQPQWTEARLFRRDDGTLALDLSDLELADLALLHDLPISALNIARTGVADFTPLAALPLTKLDGSGTALADLSPLKGQRLEELSLRDCHVADLAALQGMPLQSLDLAGAPVTSLEALRGMPLRRLDCFGCAQLNDFSPLTTLTHLETLVVPAQFTDLAQVQKLPALQRLGSGDFGGGPGAFDKVPTVTAFLAASGQRLVLQAKLAPRLEKLRQILRPLGAPGSTLAAVAINGDGCIDLDLSNLPLENLASLAGLPIRRLVIHGTKVSDLTPLRGLPLTTLDASATAIKDLTPLAACPTLNSLDVSQSSVIDLRPLAALKLDRLIISQTAVQSLAPLLHTRLRELYFDATKVEDVFPLLSCPGLESITLPASVHDLDALRKMPALQRLSFTRDAQGQPTQTVAQFWSEYDTGGKAREAEEKLNAALVKLRAINDWTEDRFQKQPDGTYKIDLSRLAVNEVGYLHDLPISVLNLNFTNVTRITPLANCPIREFYSQHTQISDLQVVSRWPLERLDFSPIGAGDTKYLHGLKLRALHPLNMTQGQMQFDCTPLKGMPLESFSGYAFDGISFKPMEGAPLKEVTLAACQCNDLAALHDAPLTMLILQDCHFTDPAPWRNHPLTILNLKNTPVRDVSTLAEIKTLQNVILPPGAIGYEKLRTLPNLKKISFDGRYGEPTLSAEEFWKEHEGPHKAAK